MQRLTIAILGVFLSAARAQSGVTIDTARFGNLFYTGATKEFHVTVTPVGFAFSGWLVTEVRDPYGRLVFEDERPFATPATEPISERYEIAGTMNGVYQVGTRAHTPSRDSPPAWQTEATIGVVLPPSTPGFDDRSAIGYYLLPDPSELGLAEDVAQ